MRDEAGGVYWTRAEHLKYGDVIAYSGPSGCITPVHVDGTHIDPLGNQVVTGHVVGSGVSVVMLQPKRGPVIVLAGEVGP